MNVEEQVFEKSDKIDTVDGQDETEVRDSNPLGLNEPLASKGTIETSQSASLTQRNLNLDMLENTEGPDMMELPLEVIKSSRAPKVVEVNLPPRGSQQSSRRIDSHREQLSSPSPHF